MQQQVPAISHRGQAFKAIFQETATNLRQLLQLPDNYHIVFVASATEIWERLIQNCVEAHSHHLVNGSFSKRFYEIAGQLGRNATKTEVEAGTCVNPQTVEAGNAELIAITQNETSTGAAQPLADIAAIRKQYPEALIAVDVVSSIPHIELDYSLIDSAYFSVQKCFGLPAGLGVWLVNDRCVQKAEALLAKGLSIGSYHNLPGLVSKAAAYQTPETPNVLGIYLLGKVAGDMLNKGLDMIRRETKYKAALLYGLLERQPGLSPFVRDKTCRSETVIVGDVAAGSEPLINHLKQKSIVIGSGYGPFKHQHIRVANFPTTSKEQIEMLSDLIDAYQAASVK